MQSSESEGAPTPAGAVRALMRSQSGNYSASARIASQQRARMLRREAADEPIEAAAPSMRRTTRRPERDYYDIDVGQFLASGPRRPAERPGSRVGG